MPPVRRRPLGLIRKTTWHVGSDDFTLPSLFAIVSRLILLGLNVGTIIYLLFPTQCEDDESDKIPPLLYISLFIFNLVLFATLINEAVIFSISLRGRMNDIENTRKWFPHVIEIRVFLTIVEFLMLIVTTIGVFNPTFGGEAIECEDYRIGPLVFAKVTICSMWVLWLLLIISLVVALNPLGCLSPPLLENVDMPAELGGELDNEGFLLPGRVGDGETQVGRRKKRYHVQLGHRKIFRRFRALCCCFGAGGNQSSALAMQDAAKAFHTLFSDLDLVPSDLLAGLFLLKRDQRQKKESCKCPVCTRVAEGSCESLTKELRELTFEHLPESQKSLEYLRHEQRPFDFDNPTERTLFEDVCYYMNYSMGIYGWTLHVFQNPITGLCSLGSVSCFKYRCLNSRAGVDFLKDNVCLCGVATMRVQSKRQEEDIVFVTYENKVFQAPFSLSVDHDRKTVVLAVRGTLSMKDALTDMSVTMVKVKIPGLESDDLYMHNGMYRTAQWIKSRVHTRQHGEVAVMSIRESNADQIAAEMRENGQIEKKQILKTTMERYWDYQLIVTGHSLGAGVAGILAVLLKPAYPGLHCFTYSSPGCIFSLPVAKYSESFITTTVLGNDLVPRVSFRSLLHMKKQVEFLTKNCKKPKPQVLFQWPWMERLFSKVTENPTVSLDDIKEDIMPDKKPLGIREVVLAKKFAKKAKANLRRKRTLHIYIKNINQGDHIASFPPGRMLHMEVDRKAKPLCLGLCYPNQMKLTWKSFEDFRVIVVDRGMVEDHLPTAVYANLQRVKKQFIHCKYNPEETEEIRKQAQEDYRRRMVARRKGEVVDGDSEGSNNWKERVEAFEQLEARRSKLETSNGNGVADSNRNDSELVSFSTAPAHAVTVTVDLEDARYYIPEEESREVEPTVNPQDTTAQLTTSISSPPKSDSIHAAATSEEEGVETVPESSTAAVTARNFAQTLATLSLGSPASRPVHDVHDGVHAGEVALELEIIDPAP